MKTKKMIAGLVSVITLASVTASAVASAADAFNVSISSAEAKAGETFTLKMDLTDIPSSGINGCEFGISYDPSLVKIDKVELGALAHNVSDVEEGLPDPLECNIEADVISLMYALGTTDSAYFMTGTGTFLNITGTVKADAKTGSKANFKVVPVDRAVIPGSSSINSDIVFGYMSSDKVIQTYTPTFTDGVLTIIGDEPGSTDPSGENTTPPPTPAPTPAPQPTGEIPNGTKYGDVDVNGEVSVADVVKLNKYLLNPAEEPITDEGIANADCQRDNLLDGSDSTLLMNYVAMLIDYDELGKKN